MFKSTKGQMEDFLKSTVWQDILGEFMALREAIRDNLESCDDEKEIFRFQGRAEALRDMILLPENILETLTEEGEKTNE